MSTIDAQQIENPEEQPLPGGIMGLVARMKQSPTKSLLLLGTILGLSVAGGISLWAIQKAAEPKLTVEEVLESLDHERWQEARLLAIELNQVGIDDEEMQGVAAYVVGCVEAHEADDEWNVQKQKVMYASVAANMQHALLNGVPDDRVVEAEYILARSLFWSGAYRKSLPALKTSALQLGPSRRTELIGYMIDVYLRDPELSKESALNDLKRILADTDLTTQQRDESLLHEANLLIQLRRFNEAQERLAHLSNHQNVKQKAQLVTGQMELAQAIDEAEKSGTKTLNETLIRNAISRFENVIKEDPENQLAHEARLKLADAHFRSGDYEQARNGYAYLSRQFEESPLGIHAALNEAAVLLRMNQESKAIRLFDKALEDASKPQNQILNRWMDLDSAQAIVRDSFHYLIKEKKFAPAVNLTGGLLKLVSNVQPPRSPVLPRFLKADAYRQWAEFLEQDASTTSSERRKTKLENARARYRDAGQAYYQYSLARKDQRDYPQQLFLSGEHYFKGHDMIRAVKAYQMYLDTGDQQSAGQAFVRLAEAHLAMQQLDNAFQFAEQTWASFPKNPVVYRARVIAATIRQEQGQLDEAKVFLLSNIESNELTPQSQEWIDSLLLYGQIQFDQASEYEAKARELDWQNENPQLAKDARKQLDLAYQQYLKSVDSLEEYNIRMPDSEHSMQVRYLLGQACSRAAQWPRLQSEITTINSKRAEWERENMALLQKAFDEFEFICDRWAILDDRSEMDDFHKQILLNSFFARAQSLFQMRRFQQALSAYRSAATRYTKNPEALEAYIQMANCQRRLNQHKEARSLISQAKQVLANRIPKDAKFRETTRYTRDQWVSLLNWLEQL